MPGIAGILATRDLLWAPHRLDCMLRSMMHEPESIRRICNDPRHGWCVGSIADSSRDASPMPITNEDGTVQLWLLGECFIDSTTKFALKRHGHGFEQDGADCLVHLYEEDGPAFVETLNGLFSGIVLDARAGKAILFTDRYSLRRLYYHEDGNGIYFASEAKALLAAFPHLRAVDLKSLAEYLCFDCVLGERSFFRGVQVLPGGVVWTSERGRMEKRSWYDPGTHEEQIPYSEEEFCERLTTALEHAVRLRIDGGRIGLALSGGLDTRLILSCLPPDCDSITAFTAGGMYRDSMDLRIARELCRRLDFQHETIRLNHEFLANYASIAARAVYLTDGLADATNAHILYLDGKVRDLVGPVAMSGAFGSQVLGRVRPGLRCRPPDRELIHGDFQPYVTASAAELSSLPSESAMAFLARREIPWYWSRFMSAHFSQYNLRLPFLDNDVIELLFRVPRDGCDGSDAEVAAIHRRKPELMRVRTNHGRGGSGPAPISCLVRRFVLWRAQVEKIFNWDTLPHSMQHLAAQFDAHLLSPLRLDRFILGWEYYLHYSRWFRNELAATLEEILLDPRTLSRPYWNAPWVSQIVNDHVRGRKNNLAQIRKVLTIELIHRELLENDVLRSPNGGSAEPSELLVV